MPKMTGAKFIAETVPRLNLLEITGMELLTLFLCRISDRGL